MTIRMAVRHVKGVRRVDGVSKDKTITVQLDPELGSLDDIKAAMARIGYEAEEI